jgi:hypothetical protein
MPARFIITHQNGPGQVPDVLSIKIKNEDEGADQGLCELLTGLGGAIAGAVNGVAGSGFSLASLACGAL